MSVATVSKRERTLALLTERALALFEEQGFDQTSVVQIAASAGVSEMTFFRHFGSKEQAVLVDPFDPVIARAIGQRPLGEAALLRAVRGVRGALSGLDDAELGMVRRRVRIIASTLTLRVALAKQNEETAAAIQQQLISDGTDPRAARAAAAALLGALSAGLFEWAENEGTTLVEAIETALSVLEVGA
ncbi:TetR family transcriptional regulator [Actinoalloteichus sp. AHMU CJ021]|nr:TetR family transcriptional regulator [Actinoalloteichus sp. AHMU CJ021]